MSLRERRKAQRCQLTAVSQASLGLEIDIRGESRYGFYVARPKYERYTSVGSPDQ